VWRTIIKSCLVWTVREPLRDELACWTLPRDWGKATVGIWPVNGLFATPIAGLLAMVPPGTRKVVGQKTEFE
jgi:hypothetical protein